MSMLNLEDYHYNYDSGDDENPARWNCAKRKSHGCPVFLVTRPLEDDEQSEEIIEVVGEHTHGKDKKVARIVKPKVTPAENIAAKNVKNESGVGETKTPLFRRAKTLSPSKNTEVGRDYKINEDFEHNHVYLLITYNARELVCINGYMYRLEGVSKSGVIFRWECIRSDVDCKTKIYTERVDENRHILHGINMPPVEHKQHEPYTPRHLSKLILKHNMRLVDDSSAKGWLRLETNSTKISPAGSSKSRACIEGNTTKSLPVDTSERHASPAAKPLKSSPPESIETRPLVTEKSTSASKPNALKPKIDVTASKLMCDKKRFFTMPSAKGHRVLCVDNMIFNYSQASLHSNRSYWACLSLRDKHYKCNARLVMEDSAEGLQIRKMSGHHNHPDHSLQIDRRLKSLGMSRNEIERNNITEIKKELLLSSNTNTNQSLTADISDSDDDEDSTPLAKLKKKQALSEDNLSTIEQVDFPLAQGSDMFMAENTSSDTSRPTSPKRRGVKRKHPTDNIDWGEAEHKMDITKILRLRSAKGGFLLCVDDFVYFMKRESKEKTHWVCIKNRDSKIQCKSLLTTAAKQQGAKIKIIRVKNGHNHPVFEEDIKIRLYNELIASGAVPRKSLQLSDYLSKSLDEVKKECAAILTNASDGSVVKGEIRKMKLYAVSHGSTSLAVRMTLKALNIPYELKNVDYVAAEQTTESYAKMNPQKDMPLLDDDGFYLPESIAIMHYLCDKYAPDSYLYPKEPKARALVTQRLCFNMNVYYASISMHVVSPIFSEHPRSEATLEKVKNALNVFETYLEINGTKYAAGEQITLADFALISSTICLEGIGFDLAPWCLVRTWYETFQNENSELWKIAKVGVQAIAKLEKNPPRLLHTKASVQPAKNVKVLLRKTK